MRHAIVFIVRAGRSGTCRHDQQGASGVARAGGFRGRSRVAVQRRRSVFGSQALFPAHKRAHQFWLGGFFKG